MVQIVLHIGAPKCGSGAIQTALTGNPLIETDEGTTLAYGRINARGTLVYGVRIHPAKSAVGYRA